MSSGSWGPARTIGFSAMDEPELGRVAATWGLPLPLRAVPATSGTQNQTFRLDSGAGTWFLRVYRNTDDVERVRYEHSILMSLAERELSFRVAAPLKTKSGGTVGEVAGGPAAVFPQLEGGRVERSSLAHARACGVALNELHVALRAIDLGDAPSTARFGELERIHSQVPDPWALPGELALEKAVRGRLSEILDRLRELVPGMYAGLPQQLCHNDFRPGNLLMRGDEVGGVLDFEFAAPDLRAIDVCTCWFWLALRGWNGSAGLDVATVRAFLDGYAESGRLPLTAEELSALPDLARLRGAVSLIHREGRRRAGLDEEQPVLDRAHLLVALDDWLLRNRLL